MDSYTCYPPSPFLKHISGILCCPSRSHKEGDRGHTNDVHTCRMECVAGPVHYFPSSTQKDAIANVRLARRQRLRRSSFCSSSCLCDRPVDSMCEEGGNAHRRRKRMRGSCTRSLAMDAAMVISSLCPFIWGRFGPVICTHTPPSLVLLFRIFIWVCV